MFKVCLEYIKILAENANNGRYDARNEWSCKTAKVMIDHLKEIDYWI
jgi:RPA family protein